MEDVKMSDMVAEMVKRAGYPYHMGTEYCKTHNANNPNCVGCESELGCSKTAEILLLVMQASLYKPKDFEDQLKTAKVTALKVAEILGETAL